VFEIVPFALWRAVGFSPYAVPPMGDAGSLHPEQDPADRAAVREPARLRESLRTGTPPQRATAIRSALPAPGVEPVVVGALDDPDPTVRLAAVHVLEGLARSRGTRGLARTAMEDPSPAVRVEAVRALAGLLQRRMGRTGPPPGRPA